MKVSVITAVLNRASTIEPCIESVASQTHPDIEHVIVDGGSTDGTLEVIKMHAKKRGSRLGGGALAVAMKKLRKLGQFVRRPPRAALTPERPSREFRAIRG